MKISPVIVAVIAVLFSACSITPDKNGDKPSWIDGASSQYPSDLYLLGRGSALDYDNAKDRARADLSKQFEVAVLERSRDEQLFSKSQTAEGSIESLQHNISRNLQTATSRSIQGIEIAELWHDTQSNQNYVLAVLSKQKARQHFTQQINDLDNASQQYLQQAEQKDDALQRAGAVHKAITAQQQRIDVQRSLQVVDISGRGLPPSMSLTELIRSRDALLNKVRLQPTGKGALDIEIQNIISGRAASAGFAISAANDADYTLQAEVQLDPVIHERGWVWLRGTFELSLLSPAGKRVGIQRWPLKASSLNIERSKQRLLNDIDSILEHELAGSVLKFVTAQ